MKYGNHEDDTAYGDLIEGYEWSHFVTLTFERPTTINGARHQCQKWLSRIRVLEGLDEDEIPYFYVVEIGGTDLVHIHALIYVNITIKELRRQWRAGASEIQLYHPGRGAAHYITKDILRRKCDYDISSNLKKTSKQLIA